MTHLSLSVTWFHFIVMLTSQCLIGARKEMQKRWVHFLQERTLTVKTNRYGTAVHSIFLKGLLVLLFFMHFFLMCSQTSVKVLIKPLLYSNIIITLFTFRFYRWLKWASFSKHRKNLLQLRIPTGRRQTSLLFTKRDPGFELGTIPLVAGWRPWTRDLHITTPMP